MRENRTYGSDGGEGHPFPTPISRIYVMIGSKGCSPVFREWSFVNGYVRGGITPYT